jgi:hypothetical protein
MSALAAEFQDVFHLYLELSEKLTRIISAGNLKNPDTIAESVLRNRDCLVRIEQMNSRVLQLSDDWQKSRNKLDPASRNEIRNLAEAARTQAIALRELCRIHVQKLQTALDKTGKDLAEIAKGAQYLKSIKPVKNNYPKFVDSLY